MIKTIKTYNTIEEVQAHYAPFTDYEAINELICKAFIGETLTDSEKEAIGEATPAFAIGEVEGADMIVYYNDDFILSYYFDSVIARRHLEVQARRAFEMRLAKDNLVYKVVSERVYDDHIRYELELEYGYDFGRKPADHFIEDVRYDSIAFGHKTETFEHCLNVYGYELI